MLEDEGPRTSVSSAFPPLLLIFVLNFVTEKGNLWGSIWYIYDLTGKLQDQVAILVQKFLRQQGSHPMEPAHVLELLTTEPTQVRRKQEIAGVQRIFGGILWADEDDWVLIYSLSYAVA